MKQPEDTKTLDLIEQQKRGRGRPAKADALTQAERAKRYRDNKRAMPKPVKSDVFLPGSDGAHAIASMMHEISKLRENAKLASGYITQAYGEINALKAKLRNQLKENDLLIGERAAAYKKIDDLKNGIKRCLDWDLHQDNLLSSQGDALLKLIE